MRAVSKAVKEAEPTRNQMVGEMHRYRLVAVLRSATPDEAHATAQAVAEAGVKFVEVTLSVPGAFGVIEKLAERSGLHVAGGTVLSKKDAKRAIAAGAQLIVSPTLELDLIPICRKEGIPCVIGASTPTEILTAARAGADLVKIFPADCVGGPNFVRQILGPMPDLRLLVSGGVHLDNVREYVELGVTGVCLSSAYLKKLFAEGGERSIVKQVKPFVEMVNGALAKSL